MASPTSPTSPGQQSPPSKERFFRYFQRQVTDLQNDITRLSSTSSTGGERNDAFDHCLAAIARLSTEVKIASSYIPAYDQRTYAEAIRALGEKLQGKRREVEPVRKFRFGKARGGELKAEVVGEGVARGGEGRGEVGDEKGNAGGGGVEVENATLEKPTILSSPGLSISDQHNASISHSSPIAQSTSAIIQNISNSAVNLFTSPRSSSSPSHPFATTTVKNIDNSLILCGHTTGPIHITNVQNSTVVTACRQFRMHASSNIEVYLHCSSRPIIENCEGVRFAPLPDVLVTDTISTSSNQWDQIDDFGWLKTGPNPHYRLLREEERVLGDVWKDVSEKGKEIGLEDVLERVGVATKRQIA